MKKSANVMQDNNLLWAGKPSKRNRPSSLPTSSTHSKVGRKLKFTLTPPRFLQHHSRTQSTARCQGAAAKTAQRTSFYMQREQRKRPHSVLTSPFAFTDLPSQMPLSFMNSSAVICLEAPSPPFAITKHTPESTTWLPPSLLELESTP